MCSRVLFSLREDIQRQSSSLEETTNDELYDELDSKSKARCKDEIACLYIALYLEDG